MSCDDAATLKPLAAATLERLAEQLLAAPLPHEDAPYSLASGSAGLALAHAHLAEHFAGRGHAERAAELAAHAVTRLLDDARPASLLDGAAGVAWAVDCISDAELTRELEPRLIQLLEGAELSYDLGAGACGLARLGLARAAQDPDARLLSAALGWLSRHALQTDAGFTWPTQPESIEAGVRGDRCQVHFELGLAHGVAGAICALCDALALGVQVDTVRPLLLGSLRWMRTQRLPPGAAACYPSHVGPGIVPRAYRLAWCRGDLGVAIALARAGRILEQPELICEATNIGSCALERAYSQSGVQDPFLCHGASGVAHLLRVLARETAQPLLAAGARRWLRTTLDMLHAPAAPSEIGLLYGTAGCALVLQAYLEDRPQAWERALLSCATDCKSHHA